MLAPTKTPVALPRSLVGSTPARSKASQHVSSSCRCCGSIARAAPAVALASGLGIRVVQVVDVPAAVGGEVADRVAALVHQLPQVVRRGHPTRIPATHADDDDRVV